MRMYSIKDALAGDFAPPFMSKTDSTALRTYEQFFSDKKIDTKDFHLFFVGFFDMDSGRITVESGCPVEVVAGKEFRDFGKKK